MYPRTEYEMTQADLDALLEQMKPVPAIMIGGMSLGSQQENANHAWMRLGEKMGFDYMTVRPSNKGDRFFTAVPSETPEQRQARTEREAETKKQEAINALEEEIRERTEKLNKLRETA